MMSNTPREIISRNVVECGTFSEPPTLKSYPPLPYPRAFVRYYRNQKPLLHVSELIRIDQSTVHFPVIGTTCVGLKERTYQYTVVCPIRRVCLFPLSLGQRIIV